MPIPIPSINDLTPEQAFSAKNYVENAIRVRPPVHPPTHRHLRLSLASSPSRYRQSSGRWRSGTGTVLGKLGLGRLPGAPTSPILGGAASPMEHVVLQNVFKSLLSPKDRTVNAGT